MSVAPEKSERDPFEQLAETFLARYRAGERPSVQEYADRYPELAEQIRTLFPALVLMEEHRPGKEGPANVLPKVLDVSKIPKQLGEYRILREVGRGGMGVVYEAVQETLGRHVALKVLPFNPLANPTHLERFRREARAAARLHHTHIVPVFGVGECEGIHFFAMQFIHGQGMDDVLGEVRRLRRQQDPTLPGRGKLGESLAFSVAESLLTGRFSSGLVSGESVSGEWSKESSRIRKNAGGDTAHSCESGYHSPLTTHHSPSSSHSDLTSQTESKYFRSVAQIGLQVADALAYAHSQGVLHRDIKPSNLLLDLAGQVWITDFGLAKTEESDELTHTGDMVGTLRYMAPERLSGKADPRSDVYGLGITLYEMLTLRPAFTDSARHEVIKKVAEEDPLLPHKLDRKIPRDLETIVLKAIAKEPQKRYTSAESMAEDLRRFLADRPIEARRSSATEQVWRWCRRNPAVASMAAALFLFAVAIAVVASIGYAQTSWALAREAEQHSLADQALTREAEQRGLAEQEATRNRNLRYAADMHLAAQLWENEPASARPVAELLQAYLPKPGEEDLREFSWYYQQRLLHSAREISVDQPVRAVRLTPDGHIITLETSYIQSRDTTTGKVAWQRRLPSPSAYWSWDLASDGRLVALGLGDGRVILYDTATGDERLFLQGLGAIKDISFSPRGEALAVIQSDGQTRTWQVSSGKELATFAASHAYRFCVLSPDGKTLVMAPHPDHYELSLYRSGQKEPQILDEHFFTVSALAFSPDGRTIASGDQDGWIRLWNAATGRQITTIPPNAGDVDALAFSPDGKRLCSGRKDGLVTVWNVATLRPLFHLKGHTTKIRSVAFAADGRTLVSASDDGTVRLWDLPLHPEDKILSKDSGCGRIAFSSDGRWLAAAEARTPLWDARTHQLVRRFDESWSVAFSPDNKVLATGTGDAQVRLWDPFTGRPLRTLFAHPKVSHHSHPMISTIAFSPDGKWLAAGLGAFNWFGPNYSQFAKVWEVDSGKVVAELPHDNTVPTLQFSPDGQTLATGCVDRRIRLWQVGSWQERPGWNGPANFSALGFVPGTRLLVTGDGEGVLQLRDADSGQLLRTFGQHPHRVVDIAFSPDGKTLASASIDRTVKLWSVTSGRELRTLRGSNGWPAGVAFAPDGSSLVSNNEDGSVRLWDTLTPWQRLEKARTALQEDIASGQKSAEVRYHLGLVLQHLGQENEAVAEFSKAIDLDPKLVPALHDRAFEYVRQGEWEKAAADFVRLVEVDPEEHWHCYRSAPLCLFLDDKEEYRQICRMMLERFGNNTELAERVAKTCLLAPDALNDLTPIFKIADQIVTAPTKIQINHSTIVPLHNRWLLLTKGLAEYRAGHYAVAVDRLNQFSPKADGIHYDATAFAVLAMAKHRLSQEPRTTITGSDQPLTSVRGSAPGADATRLAEEARVALAHAEAILSQKMPDPKAGRPFGSDQPYDVGDFHDWLHARILTREAEILLEAKKK